ncbi:DUF3592 domain-containing protein [Allohahella sp. A8]|uniref:DUF3592 domain-containing protein n=1 Tax=Allohahella sp. A8 TaxID=3141461 RepID=UPI000C091107|nr:hypothetical protein [Hahellaceae bacterium]
MIDFLLLLMGLALVTSGWFLFSEFTRFLHCMYRSRARVVSMEAGVERWMLTYDGEYRSFSFFPVIEYRYNGEPVRFTSLDLVSMGQLQVGEQLMVSFSRSRRNRTRLGRIALFLCGFASILLVAVMSTNAIVQKTGSMLEVTFASFVVALSLFIIAIYMKQQDEAAIGGLESVRKSNMTCLFLQEPTNVSHWRAMFTNARQKRRIFMSQLLGCSFFIAGCGLFIMSFGVNL